MSQPAVAPRLHEAAKPTLEEIDDLAATAPHRTAALLRIVRKRLFDSGLRVTKIGKGSKRQRQEAAFEFHQVMGATLGHFVLRARLDVARRLVVSTEIKIDDIPDLVGLSRSVFLKHFKDRFARTPSELRILGGAEIEEEALAVPRILGPLIEIAAGPDETALVSWLMEAVAELSTAPGFEALRETSLESPALFEALSVRSREEGRRDTRRGIELAGLAVASVEGGALGELGPALYVRGLARLGNARRLANDHAGSERELRRAAKALERVASARRATVKGELLCYRGTLRLFQRRFEEAGEDLHRAVGLCKSTKQKRLEAQAWMQLASLHNYAGESETARSHLLSAYRIAEAEFNEDRHLRLGVSLQLACIQAESGHDSEALALIPEARRLAAEMGYRKAELQVDWIEALARKEEPTTADWLLRRARQGFLDLGDVDYTAIVSLDLALLYESRGRAAEVVSLAAEALPALEALRLPEALEALRLLRHAIDEDTISRAVLLEARALLLRPQESFPP